VRGFFALSKHEKRWCNVFHFVKINRPTNMEEPHDHLIITFRMTPPFYFPPFLLVTLVTRERKNKKQKNQIRESGRQVVSSAW
jgi:hypothetical protein